MHSERQAQIEAQSGAQVRALLFDKASIEVLAEYFDYSNIFLAENIVELLENTRINEYAIKLEKSKQPLFRLIYSLGLLELDMLKTYIKINLVNGFIWLLKFPADASILFN